MMPTMELISKTPGRPQRLEGQGSVMGEDLLLERVTTAAEERRPKRGPLRSDA